jgi:hypothetical protein
VAACLIVKSSGCDKQVDDQSEPRRFVPRTSSVWPGGAIDRTLPAHVRHRKVTRARHPAATTFVNTLQLCQRDGIIFINFAPSGKNVRNPHIDRCD